MGKSKLTVSLAMIVKDEANHLDDCLDTVEDLVDEVVIVDTGSTDGTRDIARERADVYAERPWNGMADARNHSIDLASGDVILTLDADERLVNTEGWEDALEKLEEGADAIAFLLLNELPEGQILRADRMWQVRMWPNRPIARWVGRVHNQITTALKENPIDGENAQFHQVKVQILHHGYNLSAEELQKKYQGRIDDLLLEIEEAEKDNIRTYYQFQTANAYFMLGEKGEALKYVRECDLSVMTDENKYSLGVMGVHCCHVMDLNEEAYEWAQVLLKTWPQEIMSFLMMGLSLMGLGRFRAAYNFLGSVMALCQVRGMSYKYQLDPHYVAGATGDCAFRLERYGEAKELYRMFLSQHEDPRIEEIEKRIIPAEQAQEGEEGQNGVPQEAPDSPSGEIPDLRRTG